MANAHLRDDEQIRKGIERAEFVRKGQCSRLSYSKYLVMKWMTRLSSLLKQK